MDPPFAGNEGTPSKRQRFALVVDLEDVSEEDDDEEGDSKREWDVVEEPQNKEKVWLSITEKNAKVQERMLQTVDDLVATRQSVWNSRL